MLKLSNIYKSVSLGTKPISLTLQVSPMNYPIPISSVSVIIAYRGSDRHLLGTFNSLKMWFDNITIVGPNIVAISEEIKTQGGNWLELVLNLVFTLDFYKK